MARDYITPNRKTSHSRKYNGKCEECGTPKPLSEVYCYIDDVNPAINYSTPYLCKECYVKKHGRKQPIMNISVGTKFKGNVNGVILEVEKIENNNTVLLRNCSTGKIHSFGLEALRRCDITILEG